MLDVFCHGFFIHCGTIVDCSYDALADARWVHALRDL